MGETFNTSQISAHNKKNIPISISESSVYASSNKIMRKNRYGSFYISLNKSSYIANSEEENDDLYISNKKKNIAHKYIYMPYFYTGLFDSYPEITHKEKLIPNKKQPSSTIKKPKKNPKKNKIETPKKTIIHNPKTKLINTKIKTSPDEQKNILLSQIVTQFKIGNHEKVLAIFKNAINNNIKLYPGFYYVALKSAYALQDIKVSEKIYNAYRTHKRLNGDLLYGYQIKGLIQFYIMMKKPDLAEKVLALEQIDMDFEQIQAGYSLLINYYMSNSKWEKLALALTKLQNYLQSINTNMALKIDLSALTIQATKLMIAYNLINNPKATYYFIYDDQVRFPFITNFLSNLGFRFIQDEDKKMIILHPVTQKIKLPKPETHNLNSTDAIKNLARFVDSIKII